MSGVTAILEQIQPMVIQLSAQERLTLIRLIAQFELMPGSVASFSEANDDDLDQQMLTEQEQWFAKPESQRAKYRGQYIAVRHGAVIDQDVDQRTLLRRVRSQFAHAPIPILSGDDDATPEYTVHSFRFVR